MRAESEVAALEIDRMKRVQWFAVVIILSAIVIAFFVFREVKNRQTIKMQRSMAMTLYSTKKLNHEIVRGILHDAGQKLTLLSMKLTNRSMIEDVQVMSQDITNISSLYDAPEMNTGLSFDAMVEDLCDKIKESSLIPVVFEIRKESELSTDRLKYFYDLVQDVLVHASRQEGVKRIALSVDLDVRSRLSFDVSSVNKLRLSQYMEALVSMMNGRVLRDPVDINKIEIEL
jgi:hypothetical protein